MAPKATNTPPVWITVRFSDADPSIVPEKNDGNGGTYRKAEIGSPVYNTYAVKCGDALVKFAPDLVDPALKNRPHWCLLPKGFSVWTHVKKDRTDSYCYGLPHGKKFRSPNEFIKHLTWLSTLQLDNEEEPEAWVYCGEPKEYDQTNYLQIPPNSEKCECKYCQQGVPKPKMPTGSKGHRMREICEDIKTKRSLVNLVDRVAARREDHWWKISGLTALELKFREHSAVPLRVGEVVNYIGHESKFKLLRVVITAIENEKEVFHVRPFQEMNAEYQQALEENDPVMLFKHSSTISDFYNEEDPDLTTSPMRRLQELPRYTVRVCELGQAVNPTEPRDQQYGADFLPGEVIHGVIPLELCPYLLYPLDPSVPWHEKEARGEQWLAEQAVRHITPFALLPWDHHDPMSGIHCTKGHQGSKGTMLKFACAFVGAEKINQYDLVRISGPGIDKLDMQKIFNGYWKYLPLPLTESIMKVSCFVVYLDENEQVTHINVRGRVFNAYPLLPEYEARVVTKPNEVPISNDEMRAWPRIRSAPGIDLTNHQFEWYQYFPSIHDEHEVEIPMFADVVSPEPRNIPRTTREMEAVANHEARTSRVMPLTPENVAEARNQRERFLSGLEAMKSDVLTRFEEVKVCESKPMAVWEESLLRSIDILGRFYSPLSIYTWSVLLNPDSQPDKMPTKPLALSRQTTDKYCPQRAQAFQWAYFGDLSLGPNDEETIQVPTLNAEQFKAFLSKQIAVPTKKISMAPWETIRSYVHKEIPIGDMTSSAADQLPVYNSLFKPLLHDIDERICRRIGPLPDTPEAQIGTENLFTEEQRRYWLMEDQMANDQDDVLWATNGWATVAKEMEADEAAQRVVSEPVAKSPVKTLVERPRPGAVPANTEDNERKRKRLSEAGLVPKRAASASTDASVASQTPRANTQVPRPHAPSSQGPQQSRTITSFFRPANGGAEERGENGSMIYPKKHHDAFGGGGSANRTSGPMP